MADNEKMMNDSSAQPGSSRDYKERTRSQQEAKQTGSGVRSERDLGTVGGGNIPGSETGRGSDNSADATITSNSTVSNEDTTDDGGTASGRHIPADSEVARNTIDKHARDNLGGRNPSHPGTSMGDRDPKREGDDRRDTDITDPMTSRDPSKINQKTRDNNDAQDKK
ncbi:MAG TPA: hypothetical protein VK667_01240 [Ktedonobacteraceae bacterium]|nr:hypothetical protein [Ktedonobacteraceae bacterium]